MVGVNVIDGIVCCVDVWVAVLESRLEDEASRKSVPSRRTVIRASIAARAADVWDVGVLRRSISDGVLVQYRIEWGEI